MATHLITPPMSPQRAQTIAQAFDLRDLPPDFYANPYPVYDWLREHEPIRRMPDGSLFLTRHADLVAVYKDAQTFSSDKQAEFSPKYGPGSPLHEHHTTSLVFNDPPLHTRVRKIIMGALTRRAIEQMESGLVQLVGSLLDRIEAKGGGDLIEDFASAIPVEIIGNLLGIPHADRSPLRGWSLAILGALEPKLSAEQEALGHRSVLEFKAYLQGLIAERRKQPGDPEHDVLTRLIQSESDLSEVELLQNCIFILNAGHETTTNLIGNSLLALQEHPKALAQLLLLNERSTHIPHGLEAKNASKASPETGSQGSPEASADWNSAIDEFLRFESSNQLGNRRALADFELGGQRYPAGTLITLCIGAANRDPAVFERSTELMLHRSPNRHLAFGFGIHQCAGLQLARLEGRIAVQGFLTRFPRYRLTASPVRGGRARFRGFLNAPFSLA